jgi:hypothetical protein
MRLNWNFYTAELNRVGVTLHADTKDSLLWSGGDLSRNLNVKNCYEAIISTQNLPTWQGWKVNMWKWHLQLKIVLFFWLATENRLLTWDILQKKGWLGPGICLLCKQQTEDNSHLFIHCPFALSAWEKCSQILNLNFSWTGQTLNNCMDAWYKNKSL